MNGLVLGVMTVGFVINRPELEQHVSVSFPYPSLLDTLALRLMGFETPNYCEGKFVVLRYGPNIDLKEQTLYFIEDMNRPIEELERKSGRRGPNWR